MEPRTVAALLALGCLVLRGMTSVVLAYNVDSNFAELEGLDQADDIEAATTPAPKAADPKATQQQQTYTQEQLKCNEPNVANSKSPDYFKIDEDAYRMSKEGKNKAEMNRLYVEEEFLKRKHTARAEATAQRRDKRQGDGGGPNCTINGQTYTNQTFNNRSFNNCTFINCTFTNCTLTNCTFSNRAIISATFTNCTFNNCTFTNNNLSNCTFTNCIFTNRSFFNCNFTSCTFTTCTFPECNFNNCTFTTTTFTPPNVQNCT